MAGRTRSVRPPARRRAAMGASGQPARPRRRPRAGHGADEAARRLRRDRRVCSSPSASSACACSASRTRGSSRSGRCSCAPRHTRACRPRRTSSGSCSRSASPRTRTSTPTCRSSASSSSAAEAGHWSTRRSPPPLSQLGPGDERVALRVRAPAAGRGAAQPDPRGLPHASRSASSGSSRSTAPGADEQQESSRS